MAIALTTFHMYSVPIKRNSATMNNFPLTYLPKTLETLNKIERFNDFFNDNGCAPEYTSAWEKNKKHGIALNYLKPESSLFLHNLIKQKKPLTVLEIGTGGAYSTIVVGDALAQINNGGHVYTLEISAPKADIARVHIQNSELQNITLVEGDAEVILKDHILTNIDVLFIDAYRKRYKDLLMMCEPMLNAGAFIVADNITSHPEDVQDFLAYVKESGTYDYEIIPIGSGLLVATIIK